MRIPDLKLATAFVLFVSVAISASAAGKSEVADAAMKGDKAAVRQAAAADAPEANNTQEAEGGADLAESAAPQADAGKGEDAPF